MNFDFTEFCRANDIVIIYSRDLSLTTRGFCYYDGFMYFVIINNRLSQVQNKKTVLHEFVHIFENHFSCSYTHSKKCEQEVKYIIKEMKENYINY